MVFSIFKKVIINDKVEQNINTSEHVTNSGQGTAQIPNKLDHSTLRLLARLPLQLFSYTL